MIIGIVPVKNEDWILDKTLSSLLKFCDRVIVALDNCGDQSDNICKSYNNVDVLYVDSKNSELDQKKPNRRQVMLNYAREIHHSPVIIAVDADEIFSSEILNDSVRKQLVNLLPGNGFSVRFRELWFSPYLYRSEDKSSWSGRVMPCIWRDDGVDFSPGNRHEERIPSSITVSQIDLDLIHFARVVPVRYWSRIRHYIAHEVVSLNINPVKSNFFYSITRDEKNMKVSPVPKSWYSEWLKNNDNFLRFDDGVYNWFNQELLAMILNDEDGILSDCDIWDFDWIEYFKESKNMLPTNIEKEKLTDTRTRYQKRLHGFIRERRRYPSWHYLFWVHIVVVVLNHFNLYKVVHSIIKR